MVNYNKMIIYKLCCKNPEIKDIYVGHTCNHIRRKYEHKKCSINPNSKDYNCYVYKFIRDNGGFQNWDMTMIEEYPCENKLEAERRERYWIETLNSTLNQKIPTRMPSEKFKCECGCEITNSHQARHKRTNKHLELLKLKETET